MFSPVAAIYEDMEMRAKAMEKIAKTKTEKPHTYGDIKSRTERYHKEYEYNPQIIEEENTTLN